MTPEQLTDARKIAAISAPGSGIALLVAHIDAQATEIERLRADAERYQWLCATFGETKLPVLLEPVVRNYVADHKPSIDAAIDAAMKEAK